MINPSDLLSQGMNNRAQLEEARRAACYHCSGSYPVHMITEWTDKGTTALCPLCSVDAVVAWPMDDQNGAQGTKEMAAALKQAGALAFRTSAAIALPYPSDDGI